MSDTRASTVASRCAIAHAVMLLIASAGYLFNWHIAEPVHHSLWLFNIALNIVLGFVAVTLSRLAKARERRNTARPETITIPYQEFLDHQSNMWAACPVCNKRGVRLFDCDFSGDDMGDNGVPRCSKCDTMFAFSWKLTEITTP